MCSVILDERLKTWLLLNGIDIVDDPPLTRLTVVLTGFGLYVLKQWYVMFNTSLLGFQHSRRVRIKEIVSFLIPNLSD